MIVLYDSVDLSQIPANAQAVAGYVGGNWPTFHDVERRWRHAHHLPIAVNAGEDADCLDVEQGDAQPWEAPGWVWRQIHRGVYRPALYASLSTMPTILAELGHAGIPRASVRLWVAHWTGQPHIPPGFDGCQWTDRSLGRNLDESLMLSTFFDGKPAPPVRDPIDPPAPSHFPAGRPPPVHDPVPPPNLPPPSWWPLHLKVAGAGAAGGVAVATIGLLHAFGVVGPHYITPAESAAVAAFVAALGGYLTPAGRRGG